MNRPEILIHPEAVLRQKAKPVERVDDDVRGLMDEMLEAMYAAPGIGLAAPQIGVSKRIVVIDLSPEEGPREPLRLVNPEVVAQSEEMATREEGCLSLPDIYGDVTRPARVTVRYLDETGAEQEIEGEGLLAACLQHEIDHLNGVLFTDHLSPLKRNMLLRKHNKLRRQAAKKDPASKESVG